MKSIITLLAAISISLSSSTTLQAGPLDKPAAAPGQKYTIVGKVFQKTKDGILVECNPPSSSGYKKATGIVFVSGHPDFAKLFDGTAVKCTATESGTYEYTSVNGAGRTVQAFTFSGG